MITAVAAGRNEHSGADMRPCERCGCTDPRRMYALMRLWFAHFAELPADGGYFYLCPDCYTRLIEPHADRIFDRLLQEHPLLHRHIHRSDP